MGVRKGQLPKKTIIQSDKVTLKYKNLDDNSTFTTVLFVLLYYYKSTICQKWWMRKVKLYLFN